MGILPLRLPQGVNPQTLQLAPGDRIEVDGPPQAIAPRGPVPVRILRADGSSEAFDATAAVETQLEVELLRDGGVIPAILKKTIAEEAAA
jgi:aconitate hydratase